MRNRSEEAALQLRLSCAAKMTQSTSHAVSRILYSNVSEPHGTSFSSDVQGEPKVDCGTVIQDPAKTCYVAR